MDVELARNKELTARNHILVDRRPEAYTLLTEEELGKPLDPKT